MLYVSRSVSSHEVLDDTVPTHYLSLRQVIQHIDTSIMLLFSYTCYLWLFASGMLLNQSRNMRRKDAARNVASLNETRRIQTKAQTTREKKIEGLNNRVVIVPLYQSRAMYPM